MGLVNWFLYGGNTLTCQVNKRNNRDRPAKELSIIDRAAKKSQQKSDERRQVPAKSFLDWMNS